jgi:hypothetical protein
LLNSLNLGEAIQAAQKKRDNFQMDTYVLRDENGEYFTILAMNLKVMLGWDGQIDKTIHYTAWNLIK